jgi:UDP-glucose 4-epimerase
MILLTGAAGYVGSHLAFKLIKSNIPFIGIDNFSTKNQYNKIYYKIKNVDIGDKKKILKLISKYKIQDVIHTAAYSYPVESEIKKIKYKKNNYIKTMAFIECFQDKKINSFIFLSSSNVYSENKNTTYKENDNTYSKNLYGKYKFKIERYLKKKNYFKKVIILRMFNVAGYDPELKYKIHKSKFQRLITIIFKSIRERKKFDLNFYYKGGKLLSPKRDFIFIGELNKIIIRIFKNKKKFNKYNVYNVGSNKPVTLIQLVKKIEKIMKKKILFNKKIINTLEMNNTCASVKKIEKKLSIKIYPKLKNIILSSIDKV